MNNIMKTSLTIILLIICSITYGQSLSIGKKTINNKAKLKVVFPKDYILKFYDNNSLRKTINFKGTKYFELENFVGYRMVYKNDTIRGVFNICFFDDMKMFRESLILDFKEDLYQDRDIEYLQDDRYNERDYNNN